MQCTTALCVFATVAAIAAAAPTKRRYVHQSLTTVGPHAAHIFPSTVDEHPRQHFLSGGPFGYLNSTGEPFACFDSSDQVVLQALLYAFSNPMQGFSPAYNETEGIKPGSCVSVGYTENVTP